MHLTQPDTCTNVGLQKPALKTTDEIIRHGIIHAGCQRGRAVEGKPVPVPGAERRGDCSSDSILPVLTIGPTPQAALISCLNVGQGILGSQLQPGTQGGRSACWSPKPARSG